MALLDVEKATEEFRNKFNSGYFDDKDPGEILQSMKDNNMELSDLLSEEEIFALLKFL